MLILAKLIAASNRPYLGSVHHVFHFQAALKKREFRFFLLMTDIEKR